MTIFDYRTVFEKVANPRNLPDYYSTMYLDGYSEYEILDAAHRTLFKQAMARQEERKTAKQSDVPMDVNITSEIKIK